MAGNSIKVSMYNVGFGDCFLLRFPAADRERRVLIDCGSIKQGVAGGTGAIVEQLIEDVTDDGVAHIDVVAATHRHKDHVSGFDHDAWRDVVVDEVWLPWTEDPNDPEARLMLREMASFALALQAEFAALSGFSAGEQELVSHVLENTLGLSNDKAMATLHRGFRGGSQGARRRFLTRSADPLATDAVGGVVVVHVLGPAKDEAVLREMNPPSDESFLRAAPAGDLAPGALLPFIPDPAPPVSPPDKLKDFLRRLSQEAALLGAVALEKAVNNTSLMLAFEVGEAVLLFPGDSQWGPWRINLDDPRMTDLLKRTVFYKVGHHGSHNATPVSFVEKVLSPDGSSCLFAATSVARHGRFEEIPKLQLLEKLGAKIGSPERVIRSDKPPTRAKAARDGVSVFRKNQQVLRIDFEVAVS
jgi:beta-lactamase superfamily II metal-dependent hydrolase